MRRCWIGYLVSFVLGNDTPLAHIFNWVSMRQISFHTLKFTLLNSCNLNLNRLNEKISTIVLDGFVF
jgi:hypothetical protein